MGRTLSFILVSLRLYIIRPIDSILVWCELDLPWLQLRRPECVYVGVCVCVWYWLLLTEYYTTDSSTPCLISFQHSLPLPPPTTILPERRVKVMKKLGVSIVDFRRGWETLRREQGQLDYMCICLRSGGCLLVVDLTDWLTPKNTYNIMCQETN